MSPQRKQWNLWYAILAPPLGILWWLGIQFLPVSKPLPTGIEAVGLIVIVLGVGCSLQRVIFKRWWP